jgi:3-oxoacyl-[acyl-carrier-protein] synthase III
LSDELAMAEHAARAALAAARIRPRDLDGLWYVSCTQSEEQRHFSRLAFGLHARLGLRAEAFALELDAGCGGAIQAIASAAAQMRGAALDYVLIVAVNMPSQYFRDWEAYAQSGAWLSMYLFADGASAAVLRRSQEASGILAAYTACDPANPLMSFARFGGSMPMYMIDGRAVALGFRRYVCEALEGLRDRHPYRLDEVSRFYFHQVNAVVLQNFVAELGIPAGRVPMHVAYYGNLASAATLVLLDEDRRNGTAKPGDWCVLCAVGAGAQYGALLVEL